MLSRSDFDDLCPWCGSVIDRTRPHSIKRVYCSKACQIAYLHQLDKDGRLEAKQGRVCQECAGPIPATRRANVTRYCSRPCQQKASGSVRVGRYMRTCKICGIDFPGKHPTQIYCSNSCRGRAGCIVRFSKRLRCDAAE